MKRLVCLFLAVLAIGLLGFPLVRADGDQPVNLYLDDSVQLFDGAWLTQCGDGRVYLCTGSASDGFTYRHVDTTPVPETDRIATTQVAGDWSTDSDKNPVFYCADPQNPPPAGPPNPAQPPPGNNITTTVIPLPGGGKIEIEKITTPKGTTITIIVYDADGNIVFANKTLIPTPKPKPPKK
jgi:hypothetical protein